MYGIKSNSHFVNLQHTHVAKIKIRQDRETRRQRRQSYDTTSRRQGFTLGHSMLLRFIFPSFLQLFFPFLSLMKRPDAPASSQPSNSMFCSYAERTAIQMKSVLQVPQSWDHFTRLCHTFTKRKRKDYNKASHLVPCKNEKVLSEKYQAAHRNL